MNTQDSKYIGVHKSLNGRMWIAKIQEHGKSKIVAWFPLTPKGEVKAANAYDRKALELFGEHAELNFPQRRF